ncbi:unnamed protein product [Cladocopium goreaui]|uniref:Plastid lipid-associated protein/fibrillin conserved domain-containing protein n=1 Tax=Cladocopium goreaui TaxID=2562237 RepID=A0A9P1BJT0_9DINO|nr:unnamed protein product [Cladocopium goreaui]
MTRRSLRGCLMVFVGLCASMRWTFLPVPSGTSRRDLLLRLPVATSVASPLAAIAVPSVQEVKQELLSLADETKRGTTASSDQKRRMSQLADELTSAAPVSTKSMLTGTWNLAYTTEKEVLSLIGDPGVDVYQKVDVEQGTLGNSIAFTDGKRFDVAGKIDTKARSGANDEAPYGLRSDFAFTGASLKVPPLQLPLPPFGAGWFVSTYLDENLRVNRDSRGDLAIYVRAPA